MMNRLLACLLSILVLIGSATMDTTRCLSLLSRHMSQIGDKNDFNSLLKLSHNSGGIQRVFKCVRQFSKMINSDILVSNNGSIQFEIDCNQLECSQPSQVVNFKTTLALLDQFRISVKHFSGMFEFKYKPFGGIQRATRRMYKLLKRHLTKTDTSDVKEFAMSCEDDMDNLLNGLDKFILDQESLRMFADEFTDGYRLPFMISVLGNLYTTWMSMSIVHQACQTVATLSDK